MFAIEFGEDLANPLWATFSLCDPLKLVATVCARRLSVSRVVRRCWRPRESLKAANQYLLRGYRITLAMMTSVAGFEPKCP
jgi:hypothetical protein